MNQSTTPVTSAAANSTTDSANNHEALALIQIGFCGFLLILCTGLAFNAGKSSVDVINAKTLKDHDALVFEVEGLRMSLKAKDDIVKSLTWNLNEEKSKNMRADFCESSSQDKIAALKENREKLTALLGVAETKKIIGMMFWGDTLRKWRDARDEYSVANSVDGIFGNYVRRTIANGNLEKAEKLIAAKQLVVAIHSGLQNATTPNQ